MSTFSLLAAGEKALEIIHREQVASVMGLTSRGVFCSTENGQIFFLSYEDWRGPLTANLDPGAGSNGASRNHRKEQRIPPPVFNRLRHGSTIKLLPDRVHFTDEDITVLTTGIQAWKAAIQPLPSAGLGDARRRLARIARGVLVEGGGSEWIGCIPRWAGFTPQQESNDELKNVENDLQDLADHLRAGDGEAILLRTARILGRGSGLTPSGDDFLIGLLLGLRAMAEISPIFRAVDMISEQLIQQARQKTTTLAANLIASAFDGQADERLVSALDGILWESLPAEECTRRLIDYGGSSGGDSLLGMAMAVHLG